MRPIDANEAALGITDCLNENPHAYYIAYEVIKMFVRALDKAPTLDVVPVVRCKDCKYWLRGHDRVWLRNHSRMCSANGFMTAPIFYCALGAKMEGGNNE